MFRLLYGTALKKDNIYIKMDFTQFTSNAHSETADQQSIMVTFNKQISSYGIFSTTIITSVESQCLRF